MRLEFVLHSESDVYLLKNYDEIFESLEEYEVQLHSMLSSKHVATYLVLVRIKFYEILRVIFYFPYI